jgi:hypothetical protein
VQADDEEDHDNSKEKAPQFTEAEEVRLVMIFGA